jgi:prevent-host-death family protein
MTRTSDITSFTELRRNLREHIKRMRETGRPLFVTTNGETDAVLLSPEAFDTLIERAELAESMALVEASAEDIRRGRTSDLGDALKRVAEQLGFTLDR